ncbi:hypothetical protein [Solemya velum gill symbiont]|uniref:hypothetical protein n=1 Tax=Solemya velum gill symbiont TaxID=2340 RepID=UPI0021177403|nr:hypothetical protein [Solemya velum gill symbiont]
MKSVSMTLGRFRLTVQLIMLVTLLYGATVMGHYLSDMVSNALPCIIMRLRLRGFRLLRPDTYAASI